MSHTIKLRILTSDNCQPGQLRELYRNTVFLDNALSFVYQKVVDTFTLLYPNNHIIVEFSVFNF